MVLAIWGKFVAAFGVDCKVLVIAIDGGNVGDVEVIGNKLTVNVGSIVNRWGIDGKVIAR